jgi:adenylate cyclase class IV
MRNLELKFSCSDLEAVRRRAEQLGARDEGVLVQEDHFFPAPHSRLKLRDFGNGTGELISYRRPDSVEAAGSDYFIYRTGDPRELANVLADALGGPSGAVVKVRHLFLLRHTRIHLDRVECLGDFVELESVLSGQTEEEAHEELQWIAGTLGLDDADRVAVAYFDLLRERRSG